MNRPRLSLPETMEQLIYVGDPMCSWCWGFAPQIESLSDRHPELPLAIVVGGLRPGPNAQEMGPDLAGYLRHHWDEVGRRTGQPFDHTLLDRQGWLYDTEPACRAVVVMRELAPELTFDFFVRLQRAFYAEGVLLSDPDVYGAIIDDFAVDREEFLSAFASQDAVEATWRDFSLARSWGISGFPTVLHRAGDSARVIARGFTPVEEMEFRLETSRS